MTRVVTGLRSMLLGGMVLILGTVTGCGGGSGSSASGVIDRSSGTSSSTTPPTATEVAGPAPATNTSGAVTLSWDAPTENADGTSLQDLKGYKVHYGPSPKSYSDTIQIANPGLTTYVVQNLPTGKYYFAVTAYNSTGQESTLSGEVATQLD